MHQNEFEKSYVLLIDDAQMLLNKFDHSQFTLITDYYLNKNLRIRNIDKEFKITSKTGNKRDGVRVEEEHNLSYESANMLIPISKIKVKKRRYSVFKEKDVRVFIDILSAPMNLAIVEVESFSDFVPDDIVKNLFGVELKECPLSAWDLFNRKIGICGAPSSGKSETSKWLSYNINTRFGGNSFHVVEFATSFIQKYHRIPNFHDQFFIWYGQRSRELDANTANIVISDSPIFLSYIYMCMLNQTDLCSESAMYLSKVYKRVLFDMINYTDILFLELNNYADNNIRYNTESEAQKIQLQILQFLDYHKIRYIKTSYLEQEKILLDLFYVNQLGII